MKKISIITLLLTLLCAVANAMTSANDDLFKAIENGDRDGFRAAIDQCANIDANNSSGMTPLSMACSLGRFEIAQELVENCMKRDQANFSSKITQRMMPFLAILTIS